jgi:hypothetical protein
MSPNQMPRRNGVKPPKAKEHNIECRCLDCIDWEGNVTPHRKHLFAPGITSDRNYRSALKKAMGK